MGKMSEVPETKCGYTWSADLDASARTYHRSCCWRDTYQSSDRCIWHADPEEVGEKPTEALLQSLADSKVREQTKPAAEILDGAMLAGANLTSVRFPDRLSLRGADLFGASLKGSTVLEADLIWADLKEADLRYADLSGADLSNADVSDAKLKEANLSNVRAWHVDFHDTNFLSADLSNSELFDTTFDNASLFQSDLHDSNLGSSSLVNASLFYANLTNAYLGSADLSNTEIGLANLSGANLEDAELADTMATGASFSDANLEDSNLTNADFTECSLRWSSLTGVAAVRTNFADSNLLGADLEGASLNDSQFDGANLTGARLYNTKPQGMSINDQTVFSKRTMYEREADPCDTWHPLDEESTIPTSLPDKFALAVRSGQVLQSRFHSVDATPPTASISTAKQAIKRFRRHRSLDTEEQREVSERLKKATSVYRIRQRLQRENSRPRDVAEPYVREQHSRRKRAFVTGSYWEWFKHATYRWVMLYGESPARVVGTSIAVVAVFAAIYSLVGGIVIGGEEPDIIGNIYFSAVTFSTLGYGGIEPTTTTTQLLASVQSLIGGILIALLVAVFGRRALR